MRMRAALLSLALLVPVSLGGGALAQTTAETPPSGPDCALLSGSPMVEARLFFGRNIGDRLGVTDKAWARFVNTDIAPRFPDGLTIQDAAGHWRDSATGRLVREPSKILTLLTGQDRRRSPKSMRWPTSTKSASNSRRSPSSCARPASGSDGCAWLG